MAIWGGINGQQVRDAANAAFGDGDIEKWVNAHTSSNGSNSSDAWQQAGRFLASNLKDARGNSVLSGMTTADLNSLVSTLRGSSSLAALDEMAGRQRDWGNDPGKFDGVFGANRDRSNRIAAYLQTGNNLAYDPRTEQVLGRTLSPADFWRVAQDAQKDMAQNPTLSNDAAVRSGLGFLANSLFGYDSANRINNELDLGSPMQEGGFWGGLERLATRTGGPFRIQQMEQAPAHPVIPPPATNELPVPVHTDTPVDTVAHPIGDEAPVASTDPTYLALRSILGRDPTKGELLAYTQNPSGFGNFGGMTVVPASFGGG